MKRTSKILAVLLVLAMVLSMLPMSVLAVDSTEEDSFYRVLHLDAGRKYFTKDWIIALLYEMDAAGYNQLQLAFGNKGLRFLLDDMSVEGYSDDAVTTAVQAGNEAYYDAGDVNELTQTEMDEIIAKADELGIDIIPLFNTPFHSEALITAMGELGISGDIYYGDNTACLNLSNSDVAGFVGTLMGKYIDYFAGKGCKYFNFGADEYTGGWNDEFYSYANSMAKLITDAGMTPRCFNDSFRDGSSTYISSTPKAEVCYWYTGYSGNMYASASTVASEFPVINTNKDYYYVVSKDRIGPYSYDDGYVFSGPYVEETWINHALSFSNTTYNNWAYSNSSYTDEPAGSMFCVWCDSPGDKTETEIAKEIRLILRVMAARMQDSNDYSTDVVAGGFNADGTINIKSVSNGQISVTAPDITKLEATDVTESATFDVENFQLYKAFEITPYVGENKYEDSATVSISGLANGKYYVFDENYQQVKQNEVYEVTDGTLTFTAPHFSWYYVATADSDVDIVVELEVGESDNVPLTGTGTAGSNNSVSWTVTEGGTTDKFTFVTAFESGKQYLIVNSYGRLLTNEADTHTDGTAGLKNTAVTVANELTGDYKNYLWTINTNGSAYSLYNEHTQRYLSIGTSISNSNNPLTLSSSAQTIYINDNGSGQFNIYNRRGNVNYLMDAFNDGFSAVWPTDLGTTNGNNIWYLYEYTPETADPTVTFTGNVPGETTETIGDTTYKIIVNAVNKTVDTVVTVDATKDLSILIPANIEALGTVTYDLVSGDNITLAENGTVTGDDVSTTPAVVTATVKNAAGVTLATYTINILVTDVDLSTIDGVEINLWITNQPVAVNGWTAGTDYTSSAVNYFTLGADHAGVYSENGIALYSVLPNGDATTGTVTVEGETVGVYYWKNSFHAVDERNLGAGWTNLSESGTDFTYIRYWNNLWAYSVDGTTWVDFAATDVSATDSGEKQINIWFHQITEVTNEVSTLVTDWGPEPTNEYWTNQAIADFAVKYEDGGVTESDISMGFNIPDDRDNDTYRRDVDGKAVRIVYGIRALEDLSKGYEVYMITLTPSWIDSTTTNYGGGSYSNVDYSNGTEKAVWLLDEESLPEGMTKTTEEDMVSDYTACVVGGMPYVSKIDIFREQGVLVTYYVRAIETEQNTVLNVVWWDDEANTAISLNPMTIAVSGTGKTFASELKGTGTVTDGMNFGATGLSDNAFVTNTAGNEQKIDKNLKNLVVSNGKYRSGAYEYQYAEISPDGLTLTLHYDLKTGITFDPMYILDFGLPITFPISDTLGTYGSVVSVTMNNNGSFGTLTYDEETKKFTYVPSKVLTSTDIISITIQYMDENATTRVDTVDKNIAFAPATTVYYEEGFAQFGTGWDVITGGGWQNTTNKGTGTQEAHIAGVESNTYNNYGYDNAYAGVNSNTGATASTAADSLKFTFTGTGVDLFANCDDESGIVGVRITNANGEIIKLLTINTANTGAYATGGTAYNTPIASVDGLFHGTYTVTLYVASGSFSFDGFRVYNTIKASSTENTTIYNYYKNDLEEDPSFYELRDAVLAGLNVGNYNGIYASDIAASIYAQVYASNNTGTGALVLDASAATESDLANLLDNGPKNELYLTAGQSVTFKLNTSRQAQIGIRAVSGTGSFSIGDGTSVSVSSVDMFYDLQAKDTASGTVYTITNTGSGIISITDIKISDAVEGEIFGALTEEDITTALVAMGIPEEPAPFEPTISMKWLSSTVRAGFSGILTVTTSADVESLTVNGQALHCRTLRGMKIWTYVVTCSTPGSYTFDVVAVNADGVAAETAQTPVLTVTRSILHSFFERFF